ncbi:MAG TPA: hypothetical protein VFQ44_01790 [Streptosporangiaceae bacterium]|nr:hypothetical protein [Streptosporangiaceae bacterium]
MITFTEPLTGVSRLDLRAPAGATHAVLAEGTRALAGFVGDAGRGEWDGWDSAGHLITFAAPRDEAVRRVTIHARAARRPCFACQRRGAVIRDQGRDYCEACGFAGVDGDIAARDAEPGRPPAARITGSMLDDAMDAAKLAARGL